MSALVWEPEGGYRPDEALRVPPHAIEAEQAVLGGLMLVPDALAKVSDWLAELDFYRKDHRAIFRAISELTEKGIPCDAVTLAEWFANNGLEDIVGGTAYLLELANATPGAANIVAYAEIVAEKAKLRSAIEVGSKLAESAWKRGAESALVVADALHELSVMQSDHQRGGLLPTKGPLTAFYSGMIERYQTKTHLIGIPTPWDEVNNWCRGLRDSTLYVLAARPSMGKTIAGLNIATHAALSGVRTAFFSAEMTSEELMVRAIASEGRIPHDWVEQPSDDHFDSEIFWERLASTMGQIMQAPLIIDDTAGIKLEQIIARARRAHMQAPLRLIVVDHLHDMFTDPRREKHEEYGRIVQGLKVLAKELRCPIVLLAQLNRGNTQRSDKRPELSDLRGAGAIEEKADVVIFLHREDYYDKKTHLKGVVEWIGAKGRNLVLGSPIFLANEYHQMRLAQWQGDLPEAANDDSGAGGWGRRRSGGRG